MPPAVTKSKIQRILFPRVGMNGKALRSKSQGQKFVMNEMASSQGLYMWIGGGGDNKGDIYIGYPVFEFHLLLVFIPESGLFLDLAIAQKSRAVMEYVCLQFSRVAA